jgi:hypothetical protein
MTILFEGMIFADYHQFYLEDSDAGERETTPWTDDDVLRRVHLETTAIYFATARAMEVPVQIELHDSPPALNLDEADHVVDASLRTSGEIVVAGCTDYVPDAARVTVPPGRLRVRLVCTGLGTISEDGLDGADRYVLHLWPGEDPAVIVLRQWDETTGTAR